MNNVPGPFSRVSFNSIRTPTFSNPKSLLDRHLLLRFLLGSTENLTPTLKNYTRKQFMDDTYSRTNETETSCIWDLEDLVRIKVKKYRSSVQS